MRHRKSGRDAQGGTMLMVILFFMVVGGLLAAAVLSVVRNQSTSTALDLQGVRAYWAARSGIEWGAYQVLDPDNALTLAPDQLPPCFASPKALSLPGDLAGFSVQVTCQRSPASGSHEEQQNRIAGYLIVATASSGAAGGAERVERRIESRVTKCKAPVTGSAPDYAC